MPALYAHWRFGNECIPLLPQPWRKICLAHRALFDLGVHGPDILFYYRPLTPNAVNRCGMDIHFRPGREFFTPAAECCRTVPQRDETLAYLLGFLCHFALDAACHGYINRMDDTPGLTHNRIESRYEEYLMRLDGLDPVRTDRAQYLRPAPEAPEIISRFFPFPPHILHHSLRAQRMAMRLFFSPSGRKRRFLQACIRRICPGKGLEDVFLDGADDAVCAPMCEHIHLLYGQAINDYPALTAAFAALLNENTPLPAAFDRDFEGN